MAVHRRAEIALEDASTVTRAFSMLWNAGGFWMQAECVVIPLVARNRARRVFAESAFAVDRDTRQSILECWDVARAEPLEKLLELVGPITAAVPMLAPRASEVST
jgi:hypothetical protein